MVLDRERGVGTGTSSRESVRGVGVVGGEETTEVSSFV